MRGLRPCFLVRENTHAGCERSDDKGDIVAIVTLEDLVTPGGHASFREAFAAKTRWHRPVDRAAAAQALLPWTLLDGLIANGLVPADRLRIAVNGNDLPAAMFTGGTNRLRADAVQGLAGQGATLIIQDIGALVPALGELETAMERELRCVVHVNCYLTFGEKSAFVPHHDAHDVLVLQIHGSKAWRSFGSGIAFPVQGGRPRVDRAPEWEGSLTPGDVLYLPRGEIHAAVPEVRPSVHLTIGITEATGVDFLHWLATRAQNVEALRRALGSTLSGETHALRSREFARAARDLLEHSDMAEFFEDQDRDRALRPVVSLDAGRSRGGVGTETRLISALRRRVNLNPELEGEIQMTLGKQTVRLSMLSRRILAAVTAQHRITVAALAVVLRLEPGDRDLLSCLEELSGKSLIAFIV